MTPETRKTTKNQYEVGKMDSSAASVMDVPQAHIESVNSDRSIGTILMPLTAPKYL